MNKATDFFDKQPLQEVMGDEMIMTCYFNSAGRVKGSPSHYHMYTGDSIQLLCPFEVISDGSKGFAVRAWRLKDWRERDGVGEVYRYRRYVASVGEFIMRPSPTIVEK